ncbi:MAG: phosphoribosylamine--glycine ligase [Deltaproteobacteria bacterium]|nr:phosphoribosylamine--glycine ligase [Deltaproteobacteria bacterium]
MKILVVGSGGREHALCWKILQSPEVTQLFCVPGNAGTAKIAQNVAIDADDVRKLVAFAEYEELDLVVVGPEAPLVAGLVDELSDRDIPAFGPTAAAARIEGSKAFTKSLLERANVPTARARSFADYDLALDFAGRLGSPVVLKADGLAAGTGVLICETHADVEAGLREILVQRKFGDAGRRVLVEEFLDGEEASFLALTDGKTILPLATSQDHKRVNDGDRGPNTGGMGAYSPAPVVDDAVFAHVVRDILEPTVRALAEDGTPYRGVLYAGLMIKDGRAKVLEYNARLGDPETQPLLARMKSDLVPLMKACVNGTLAGHAIEWDPRPAVCVVMTAGGYPGAYKKGKTITGHDEDFGPDTVVFHAGTDLREGRVVTSGGRVLGVTALGDDIARAIENAYAAADRIRFEGAHFRRDIGARAIRRLTGE